MDHMKEALLAKIKHHKAKMGGHEEHAEAGLSHSDEDDHVADQIGDKAPELSADQNDHAEEEAGEINMEHPDRADLLESIMAKGTHRNPKSLHGMAHEHMKKDLHSLKGQK